MKIKHTINACVFFLAVCVIALMSHAAPEPGGQFDLTGGENVESRQVVDPGSSAIFDLQMPDAEAQSTGVVLRFEVVMLVMVGLVLLLFLVIRPSPVPPSSPAPQAEAAPADNAEVHAEKAEAVAPDVLEPPVEMSDRVAIELALQTWRLEKRIKQLPLSEHPKLLRRMEDSIKKLTQLLADHQVAIDDPLHRKYVDGWVEVEAVAAETVTADEYPAGLEEGPFVHETRRPIVRRDQRPIAKGEVVIAEK